VVQWPFIRWKRTAVGRAALSRSNLTDDECQVQARSAFLPAWSIMAPVTQSGRPNTPLDFYGGAALAGVALMAVGIVGGVILKDLSELAVMATTLPGIALLLAGIRGKGRDRA
jgi:hypothetical protein